MAIIYSYPTEIPTANDLVLGTDVDAAGKPTKNFTVQSILDLVLTTSQNLAQVLTTGNDGGGQNMVNIGNITANSVVSTFTGDLTGNVTGNLNGIHTAGSINGVVTGFTQPAGTSNTTLATTKFVMDKVDPSILTFVGASGGNQTVNLASQTFSLLGTANQIESVGTAQTITFKFPTAGVILPNGSTATTQATTDDSDKVATTKFVHDFSDAQDLDFTDGTSSGSVILGGPNAQTFSVLGTANQVVTSASSQTLTISLPNPVVRNLTGDVTGILKATSSIAGVAGGTDAQNVLAVTQTAGDNSTRIATTAYVDTAAGAKTLDYAGDATGPFALNLSTDDLEFNGDTNITVTAAAVAANKGIVTIDLNNDVTITGTSKAGTFTTTAGTATWTTTVLAGFTSITSALFVGDASASTTNIQFQGNASTAAALKLAGQVSMTGDATAPGVTYTNGGGVPLVSSIAASVVYNKELAGFNAATGAVANGDSIIEALEKLQGQITNLPQGIVYQGIWKAGTVANTSAAISGTTITLASAPDETLVTGMIVTAAGISGTSITISSVTSQTEVVVSGTVNIGSGVPVTFSTLGGYPDLTAAGKKVNGHYYIVSVAGHATPNGAGSTPNDWDVRDWCVFADDGAGGGADEWQKIDNSSLAGGTGTTNTMTKWLTNQTIGNSTITDDGSTVTIADTVNFTTQGINTFGNSNADTSQFLGAAQFDEQINIKKGLGVWNGSAFNYGPISGTTKRVLTSGGAVGSPPTWEVPTVGVVTSITGDYGITIGGTAAIPTVAITTDTNNLINQATAKATPVGADTILINDSASTPANALKKATLTSIKTFTAENWILSDGSNTTTISDGDTATFAGGTYITTGESSGTLTITHDATSRTDTTSTDGPAFGGTFEAVTSVTSNATGHVTAIDVSTITIPSLPTLDNYQYWTLSDGTTTVNISSTNTAKVVGGTGITSAVSTTDKSVTLNFDGTFPAAHGTQYSLPLWTTATTLGDSQISQNSLATEITATQSFKVTGKHLSVGGGTTKGLTVGGGGPTKAGFNFGTSVPSTNQDFVAQQGIHYSGRLSANSTKKVMATVADSVADADFFGITARVYITSGYDGNASNTDVRTARIYDVACIPGQTPVFNKVIDQTTVGTLTVEFDAYTDGAATPKRGFTVNFTTDSGSNSQFYTTIEMLSARRASVIFAAS
jgi:hypothetical protein